VTEEVQQVPADGDESITEAWQRLTDEPDIRGVEAARWDDGQWQVTIWAQEFFRTGSLGVELRQRLASELAAVEGVTSVGEWDNESWCVEGTPSGEELTSVAANVVDNMADRLRNSDEGP
jgi:hypothetical protein